MSTVYLAHTDKAGNERIERHECWDTDRFLQACVSNAADEGGNVRASSEAEYRAAHWPTKQSK